MATATRNLIFTPSRSEYDRHFPDFEGLLSSDDIFRTYQSDIASIKSLVHLTSKAGPILNDKVIYSSAGGLLGGVYVVPASNDGLHGLGSFIAKHESMFLAGERISQGFLFTNKFRVGLVDYLNTGTHYYKIYNESPELRASTSRSLLASKVTDQKLVVHHSLELLLQDKADDAISSGVPLSGTLQSFYFEILMEYLFRKFTPVQRQNGSDELNVYSAKTMLFSLNPELKNGFSLKRITCLPSSLDGQLSGNAEKSSGTFAQYLKLQLPQYVKRYLSTDDDWYGHTLFRQFNHRVILEQLLAAKLWKEANTKNVSLVTYRLPKGEFALLPTKNLTAKLMGLNGEHAYEILNTELSIGKFHGVTVRGTLRNPYQQEAPS